MVKRTTSTDSTVDNTDVAIITNNSIANTLSRESSEQAHTIASNINLLSSSESLDYASDAGHKIAALTEQTLEKVRATDTGLIGEKLTEVLEQARALQVGEFKKPHMLSKMPVIGKFFNTLNKFSSQFDSASAQIDVLIEELDKGRSTLRERVEMLDEMYTLNLQHFDELSVYIAAGEIRIEEAYKSELVKYEREAEKNSAIKVQELNDFKNGLKRFEKKVHDLKLIRTHALQSAPQLRIIQHNSEVLAERISSTKMLTVPLFKNQYVLAHTQTEQNKIHKLDEAVTNVNNELMIGNAELLEENTLQIAKQAQRGVIDIDTLSSVQKSIISTIEGAIKIEAEGAKARLEAEKRLDVLESELKNQMLSRQ